MSVLENVKKIIKDTYEAVNGKNVSKPKTAQNGQQSKVPNSVIQPNSSTINNVGDVVVKSAKPANNNLNQITQTDVDKLNSEIQNKIQTYLKNANLSYTEIRKIIFKNMNYSYAEFIKLPLEEQYKALVSVNAALDKQIKEEKEGRIQEDIDRATYIGMEARNYHDAADGNIEKIREFQNNIDNHYRRSIKKFDNAQTDEERATALNEERELYRAEIKRKGEARKKGRSKAEQARIDRETDKLLVAGERAFELNFIASHKAEYRRYSVYTRSGEYLAESYKNAIDLTDEANKAIVAGTQTHEFSNQVLKFKYEHGDEVPADVYGQAIEYSMQYKTAEDATQFEQDAYEFRQKVENGEIDAPWMSKEHFEEEAAAIGAGISANENMTSEEKAELLKQWDSHTSSLDHGKISEKYNNYIQNSNNQNLTNSSAQQNSTKTEVDITTVNYKATKKELEDALSSMSFSEVKRKYPQNSDRELVEAVLHNPKLKGHKTDIVSYIKSYSPEELYTVTKGCSTEMFCFVLRNVSPDKAGKLYDLSENDKCYATRKLGEKIIEESRENEAA